MKKEELLYKLSNRQLLILEKMVPKRYVDFLANIRLNKYVEETNFEKLTLGGRIICIIDKGEWDYPLFQISFLNNMLANIVDCLSKGYAPMVCFKNTRDNINLWEQFLEQMFEVGGQKVVIYDKKRAPLYFPLVPSNQDVEKFSSLLKRVLILNESTKDYIEKEYNTIIRGKRVLGVLCRGTDYTANKPKGHPVQPEVEEIIIHVNEKIKELNCDYIYLATEEERILKQFLEVFPNRILTNSRYYYDEFYSIKERMGDLARISQVDNGRENGNYYKSLEYLSSIYLLSKCNAFVAGNCGGSRAALYLNDNSYEYCYLFDCGTY